MYHAVGDLLLVGSLVVKAGKLVKFGGAIHKLNIAYEGGSAAFEGGKSVVAAVNGDTAGAVASGSVALLRLLGATVSVREIKKGIVRPITGPKDKSWKAIIHGTAQKTGTPGHQFRTYREAIREAKKSNVISVHLDHGYNRSLDLDPKTISPNHRPDVLSIYDNKSVLPIEIQSKTDLPAVLRNRNSALKQQLIDQGFSPLPPRVVKPNSPSVKFRK